MKKLLMLCLLLLASGAYAAGVNKCVDAKGNLTLTDEPCDTLKPRSDDNKPPKLEPANKPAAKPLPPILPPAEQQLPQPPRPAPAEKPQPY